MTPETDHPTAAPEPYSQHTPCPKCESLAVTTEMCTRTVDRNALFARLSWPATCWWDAWLLPHHHRDCQNCGWTFYQRPLDAARDDYTPDRLARRKAEHERREEERKQEREKLDAAVSTAMADGASEGTFAPDDNGRTRWFRRGK